MKIENQTGIIGLILGATIGITAMSILDVKKSVEIVEKTDKIVEVLRENVNTCEDIVEWMNEDVEDYADSTVFDMYIYNLEQMCEENRVELLKIYRNE